MTVSSWRDELRLSQRKIEVLSDREATRRLNDPVSSLELDPLFVLNSDYPLNKAAKVMFNKSVEFALVQDDPDTILGVLRRDAVHAALISSGDLKGLTVANVMDRNICVEPDSATISEVLNRMAWGGCCCAVLIDSKGEPVGLASPKTLMKAVSNILEGCDTIAERVSELLHR
ncbi:MAG: CBS domain-containing protein [Candidatus Dadabacteria bacterium]|nr:MAG: CBS domain-containing protein [Candidatus Dadabacteria bacterium]